MTSEEDKEATDAFRKRVDDLMFDLRSHIENALEVEQEEMEASIRSHESTEDDRSAAENWVVRYIDSFSMGATQARPTAEEGFLAGCKHGRVLSKDYKELRTTLQMLVVRRTSSPDRWHCDLCNSYLHGYFDPTGHKDSCLFSPKEESGK
jgi:hypothetical protein